MLSERRRITERNIIGEIVVDRSKVLKHFFNPDNLSREVKIAQISAQTPPVYEGGFYLANVGTNDKPLFLELRFEPIALTIDKVYPEIVCPDCPDKRVSIALLMTNERSVTDLRKLGNELYERVISCNIYFDCIVAMESLGPKLSQALAETVLEIQGKNIFITSFQKGKPRVSSEGIVTVGPPKPWIDEEAGIDVNSGTSHPAARQKLYLDQKAAAYIKENNLKVLIVDDARMTQGSINAGIALLRKFDINISGVTTVLNEGLPTGDIDGIPYVNLTKLPLFMMTSNGLYPIPGTYQGLKYFYKYIL